MVIVWHDGDVHDNRGTTTQDTYLAVTYDLVCEGWNLERLRLDRSEHLAFKLAIWHFDLASERLTLRWDLAGLVYVTPSSRCSACCRLLIECSRNQLLPYARDQCTSST